MPEHDSMFTAATLNDPRIVPLLFSDPPNDPVLHYDRFDLKANRRQMEERGFVIAKHLVSEKRIERIRSFWISTFAAATQENRVTWAPFFGQANHVGFSSDKFQHLFRACDFLWNEPFQADTREVCLRTHALRNMLLQENPMLGTRSTDGRYGIFITASYYPPNQGRMEVHDDGVAHRTRHFHSLVPITFKGRDYKDGGLMIYDRRGQIVYVEDLLEPGDVIFYDGALKHGVMPIVPFDNNQLGRIQVFPIPAVFKNLEDNVYALSRVPAVQLFAAKRLWFANRLRILLGFNPAMR